MEMPEGCLDILGNWCIGRSWTTGKFVLSQIIQLHDYIANEYMINSPLDNSTYQNGGIRS
jgi:hypothetical protein